MLFCISYPVHIFNYFPIPIDVKNQNLLKILHIIKFLVGASSKLGPCSTLPHVGPYFDKACGTN
jgi:hypothetical protein